MKFRARSQGNRDPFSDPIPSFDGVGVLRYADAGDVCPPEAAEGAFKAVRIELQEWERMGELTRI